MDGDSSRRDNQDVILHGHGRSSKPDIMQLQHLKQITNNFSDERVLGKGGFGVVYKGVLQNGEIVAVKKLLQAMPNFVKQFENEVHLLMRLKHPNIVRLVGYCYETQNIHLDHNGKFIFAEMTESLLCLEYLPKGSLDNYLSDESSGLDWRTRYKIIEGICYGLQYLHEQNKPIIHLDLKPANILLDDNMVPKITDFGLSRLLDQQQTMCTLITNGTRGYMPPEYIQGGTITPMSDIFSLGVIILEVITGHRDYPDITRTSSEGFIELTLEKWRNMLEKAPGYTLLEIDCQQIKRCIQIGLICVNPERIKRPTTTKIIKMLQGLESTDCHISNEVTSSSGQITSGPRELLDIQPLELCFSLERSKRIPCLVKLTNKTDGYIAFHFKVTKATNNYCIEPTGGFLWPRSTFNVVVTVDERHELPSDLQCDDEFLVQSMTVRVDRLISNHITEDTFNNISSNMVHKVNLRVVYVPPVQSKSGLDNMNYQGETKASDPQQLEGALENIDALIGCVAKNLGYCEGKPVAALTIFKCLVHWKSFEAGRTSVFDRLLQLIGSSIENEDADDNIVYWLSNTSTLLLMLHRSFEADGISRKKPPPPTSLFHRMSQGFRSSIATFNMPVEAKIEAKYPALLFKQQLTAYVEKIYGIIRDNIKKELSSSISLCIQLSGQSESNHWKRIIESLNSFLRILQDNHFSGQSESNHWKRIIESLNNFLRILQDNHVPPILAQKCFTQIFSYINAQLFNSILLRRECCSLRNGEYVKAGLSEFELWCAKATAEYAATSWDELKHIRQAIGFLVIFQKKRMTFDEIANDLCPILSVPQLYRICTLYWDDKYNSQSVSPDVISSMRLLLSEDSNNAEDSSFLLDDNSSIPFSVDDISNSVHGDFTDVKPPEELLQNQAFQFLRLQNLEL